MLPITELNAQCAKKIKYVLCDIDDTITENGKLPLSSYAALWQLHDAGICVIPVTGRPAGWCDLIIRQWPVSAVIGENGAFTMYFSGSELKTLTHPSVPGSSGAKLEEVREAVLAAVPGARVSKDQFARRYDLAIDFCEDLPKLPLSDAEKIRDICLSFGAEAKISSIHVNTWFGKYDKVSMARLSLRKIFGEENPQECVIFFGDSPNDEPMFEFFPLSCAVANIRDFAAQIKHPPEYVTASRCADGFAEGVAHILSLR